MTEKTNDRELLELAAKAAGIDRTLDRFDSAVLITLPDGRHESQPRWSPLIDDGDALRLAVKLRLDIEHNQQCDHHRWVSVSRRGRENCYAPVRYTEEDFDESQRVDATCRAIVGAAAEIGRNMP